MARAARLADRLTPGLSLGSRLLWRPWQRLKRRMLAWLMSLLIPVLFSALLPLASRAASPSRAVTSPTRPATLAPPLRRLLGWIARLAFRKMTEL